jgi:prepilin-type N-terminal cleavage/methylation domain-containing protein
MKRSRRGFTLSEAAVVIVVFAILALIVGSRLLGKSHFVQAAEQQQAVKYSAERVEAFQQVGKVLLVYPDLVTDKNWRRIASIYVEEIPEADPVFSVSNIHFRPWTEVQKSGKPASETPWAYELYDHQGELAQGYENAPCLFLTEKGKEYFEDPKYGEPKYDYERTCLVLFADGHAEAVSVERLRELGLLKGDDQSIVYIGNTDWLPYNEWQKLQKGR